MRNRFRVRRMAKWALSFFCLALIALWVFALQNAPMQMASTGSLPWMLYLQHGALCASKTINRSPPRQWFDASQFSWVIRKEECHWPSVHDHSYGPLSTTHVIVPLWIPLLGLSIPTGLLWICDRGSALPGHCQRCGYNLNMNVSGQCPECGLAIKGQASSPIERAEQRE